MQTKNNGKYFILHIKCLFKNISVRLFNYRTFELFNSTYLRVGRLQHILFQTIISRKIGHLFFQWKITLFTLFLRKTRIWEKPNQIAAIRLQDSYINCIPGTNWWNGLIFSTNTNSGKLKVTSIILWCTWLKIGAATQFMVF